MAARREFRVIRTRCCLITHSNPPPQLTSQQAKSAIQLSFPARRGTCFRKRQPWRRPSAVTRSLAMPNKRNKLGIQTSIITQPENHQGAAQKHETGCLLGVHLRETPSTQSFVLAPGTLNPRCGVEIGRWQLVSHRCACPRAKQGPGMAAAWAVPGYAVRRERSDSGAGPRQDQRSAYEVDNGHPGPDAGCLTGRVCCGDRRRCQAWPWLVVLLHRKWRSYFTRPPSIYIYI